jgi:hypothetical protein
MGATPTLHQRNKLKPHELTDIDIDPPWPIRDFVPPGTQPTPGAHSPLRSSRPTEANTMSTQTYLMIGSGLTARLQSDKSVSRPVRKSLEVLAVSCGA